MKRSGGYRECWLWLAGERGKPTYDEPITAEEKGGPEGIEMEKDDLYD